MGTQTSHNETEENRTITVPDAREKIDQFVADPQSEAGQQTIQQADSHVLEVWEDGEVTSTKSHNGDLYRQRRLHQTYPPIVEGGELLFDVENGSHRRMVVTDKDGLIDLLLRLRRQVVGEDHVTRKMERRLD